MKHIYLTLLISFLTASIANAQDDAFTSEVSTRNGIVYYKGNPLNGTLYEYNDNAKTACFCTLKAQYTSGQIDGTKEEWYIGGQKKNAGTFSQGKMAGTHKAWTVDGALENEKTYTNGKLSGSTLYYTSGIKKQHKEYDTNGGMSVLISEKKYSKDNSSLLYEASYKDSKPHGEHVQYYSNGAPKIRKIYTNGNLSLNAAYYPNGNKKSVRTDKSGYSIVEEYYDNSNLKASGFYRKNKKDSIWLEYNARGEKIKEVAYNNNTIVRTGFYSGNKKNGAWEYNFRDNITQKIVTYKDGEVVDSQKYRKEYLIKNLRSSSLNTQFFTFDHPENEKEIVAIQVDGSKDKDNDTYSIYMSLLSQFKTRLTRLERSELSTYRLPNKIIKIQAIEITYKESTYTKPKGGTEKGYDSFITFDITLYDTSNNTQQEESFTINKSNKLVSSLFNTLASTYAKSRQQALIRTKKEIDISEYLMNHFALPTDLEEGKRKKK